MEAIGSQKELRKLEKKVESLEVQVEELSRKIEARDEKKNRIGKMIGSAAEILTIVAGILAIVEFLQ